MSTHHRRAAALALAGLLVVAATASAQTRPFVFSVVTSPAEDRSGAGRAWTAFYGAGYAERTAEPFGYDGVEQRVGVQGRLGRRLTLVGAVGLGASGEATRSSQEAEMLVDVLGPASRLRVAVGAGGRREWTGTSVALGRACVSWSAGGTLVSTNVRLEKPLAADRDAIDVITTAGWLQSVGRGLRVGVEAVGEDLEGFWEAEEAEGGAKLYAGPAVHWAAADGRVWASASGGPIVYATRSDRTSTAPRPLEAAGNGFTVRASVGFSF